MEWSPERRAAEQNKWKAYLRNVPSFAERVVPAPGQESVWDYPRPPRVEQVPQLVRVEFAGIELASTERALRVLETASPPVYYLPPADVDTRYLEPGQHHSFCEWKGMARYWTVRVGTLVVADAAWSYPEPEASYAQIRDHFAFYAAQMDACWVGDDLAEPQPGGFYGGWVTPNIVGPFKGEPGTEAW